MPTLMIASRTHVALAQDTFSRGAVGSGWGTATDGEAWTRIGNSATVSTNGSQGLMATPANGTVMVLGSGTYTDVNLLARFKIAATGDNLGFFCRGSGTNTAYYLDWVGNGTNQLRIRKDVAGTNTTLATTSFTMSTSTKYWMRGVVVGPNLYLRIWTDGSAEPTTWSVTYSGDTSIASGNIGLQGNPSTSTPMQYDAFVVTGIASRAPEIRTRLPLRAQMLPSVAGRLRLALNKMLSSRIRLASLHPSDVNDRLRLASPALVRTMPTRLLYFIGQIQDTRGRLILRGKYLQDTPIRLICLEPLSRVMPLPLNPETYIGTGGMLPIAVPATPYQINGVPIDTPVGCTTPMTMNGVTVFAQSQFLLTFANPSAALQTVLLSNLVVTMTFALANGEMVTGLVRIQVMAGPLWQVLCTTLVPITVQRWTIQSQFA